MFGLKRLERRLQGLALFALIGGVGVGGYTYRDHPFVRGLLALVSRQTGLANGPGQGKDRGDNPDQAEGLVARAEAVIKEVVDDLDGSREPGTFEVAIAEVRLDGREFHAGRAVDLETRVILRAPEGGKDAIVWSSSRDLQHPAHPVVAGDGPITAGWSDRPFRVDWRPGDEFTVEVWDIKKPRAVKCYTLDLADASPFPLRTKTHTLDARADGERALDPSANTVSITARRLGDLGPDAEPAVAEGRKVRQPTRR